jgi:outer membrane protein assembly factor BamB
MIRRAMLAAAVLAVGVLSSVAEDRTPSNWPRFRGPNGTGVSTDKGIPVKFTEQDGLLWKTPIPGLGHGSPIAWGDRVFLHTSSGDAKERMLLCLDAKTGKMLWSRTSPGKLGKVHRDRGSHASSTPATDGQRVYVVFWDGEALAMHAYDFEGHLSWKKDLGAFQQTSPTTHGAGNSPVVYDGKIYFANEQDDIPAHLLCLDAKTGEQLWQAERPGFKTCYSSPFMLERDGKQALIVSSSAGVGSYDPKSGEANWLFTWTFESKALRTVGSPIFADGLIIATSGDGGGARHALALKPDGQGDVSKTNLVWEDTKTFPYVPTLLVDGEYIYAVADMTAVVTCLKAKTGEQVWKERLGGKVSASPIMIDGKVYVCTEDGEVYVFRAGPKFEQLGKSSIKEPIFATPAVAGGRLFIRGRTNLYCIGSADK